MGLRRGYVIMATTVALAYLAGLTAVFAADEGGSEPTRVPVPEIARGQGDSCVEDTDFMRRNHMTLLLHQRDDTMLKGIRSEQHSLKECVSCHAVEGSDAVAVSYASEKHFCRSCHDYAAVKIDCFECHASRPEPGVLPEGHGETVVGAVRE